jgi:thioredoxin-like negative regulator of GroEL
VVKRWRAHRFAAEGETLVAKKQWEPALRKAQQAVQLSGSDGRSLRLMAQILTRAGHEQALPFWRELLKTGEATAADRNEMIGTALQRGDWATAREQLLVALKNNAVPETFRLTSDYYAAQGDLAQGLQFARQALQASPADTTNALLLAHRLMTFRSTNETREAFTLLKQIASSPNPTALDAVALLATRFQPAAAEVDQYISLLQTHPAHTLAHEFFALDLRVQFKPAERQQAINQAAARYTALDDEALVQFGRWLNRNREHDLAVKVIPLQRALGSQDLFLIHLDALAALHRWIEVDEALQKPSLPLDAFFVNLYQVRVAMELNRKELVPVNWSLAHRRAVDNPQQLAYLAQYAEKIGAGEEAVKAYRRLTEIAPEGRDAYVALLRLLEQVGQTRDVREVLRRMVERFPDETAARNDYAYLNLLLNENVEVARQISEQLYQADPSMLAHRTTLALAYLRLQQPQNARPLLTGLKVEWNKVLPGWQCVYAATLATNGDMAAAKEIARRIPLSKLKPEERLLIQGLL